VRTDSALLASYRRATTGVSVLTAEDVDVVRRVLYLHGLRDDAIDDAVQDVHLRVLERAPRGALSLRAWACAVATNLAFDAHRRSRSRRVAEERIKDMATSVIQSDDVALVHSVACGLERLAPELRAVVVLRLFVDLPVRDVAEALGVPEGTVKSRLHRAVSELRRWLPKESLAS
jgi:RNA polymerase sigma-70 factor (ECF subfamily)